MTPTSRVDTLETLEDKALPVLEAEASKVDAEGRWPDRSLQALRDAGLFGLTLPVELGGSAGGMREFVAITERMARSCASTAMIYLMHVCGAQVIAAGRFPKREEVIRRIVSGGALTTLAFSERGSRSHFWAPVSRATADGREITLNSEKSFVTSAGHADYYVVSSGAVEGKTPLDSSLYLVEEGTPGMAAKGGWNGLGLRGNGSAPMVLNDCRVPEDHRLTAESEGFKTMMVVVLPWFQIGSAAVSLGIAEAAFTSTVKHTSSTRLEHLGESLASAFPGVRARLARMKLTLDSARAFLDRTVSDIESASPAAMTSVLGVKVVASEAAIQVTDEAMRACGGAAFGRQLTVERNFRDARAASVMAPTTDALYEFLGKAIAGLPLF